MRLMMTDVTHWCVLEVEHPLKSPTDAQVGWSNGNLSSRHTFGTSLRGFMRGVVHTGICFLPCKSTPSSEPSLHSDFRCSPRSNPCRYQLVSPFFMGNTEKTLIRDMFLKMIPNDFKWGILACSLYWARPGDPFAWAASKPPVRG